MKGMKVKILIIISLCVVPLAFTLRAEEWGQGHYISGLFNDFSGMPPTAPGYYFGNYFLDYRDGTVNANKELPIGGVLAAGVTANMQVNAPLAIYAYPLCLGDVTLSSGIGLPIVWADVEATATFSRARVQLTGAKSQSAFGFGDMQIMPIMAGWTNGDFKLGGIMNVWAPTGGYEAGRLANTGLGYWTFTPMVAFSWLSTKIGTEFTIFSGVDFNTENHATDYRSGDVFHVDATLAQHLPLFGGIIGAGVAASYLQQFTGDSGSGAKLGDFKAQYVTVGPTVSYVHPIGKCTLVASASWLPQVHTENTTKGSFIWAKVSLAF